ncbi:MAG TPA: PP2C family protein-serine/threonine phosphatase [Gammaproteobacteria bacterium]|nr:PP2C family protein-serine/threonine phosphatase [Gammaproteobacteria bacterium]
MQEVSVEASVDFNDLKDLRAKLERDYDVYAENATRLGQITNALRDNADDAELLAEKETLSKANAAFIGKWKQLCNGDQKKLDVVIPILIEIENKRQTEANFFRYVDQSLAMDFLIASLEDEDYKHEIQKYAHDLAGKVSQLNFGSYLDTQVQLGLILQPQSSSPSPSKFKVALPEQKSPALEKILGSAKDPTLTSKILEKLVIYFAACNIDFSERDIASYILMTIEGYLTPTVDAMKLENVDKNEEKVTLAIDFVGRNKVTKKTKAAIKAKFDTEKSSKVVLAKLEKLPVLTDENLAETLKVITDNYTKLTDTDFEKFVVTFKKSNNHLLIEEVFQQLIQEGTAHRDFPQPNSFFAQFFRAAFNINLILSEEVAEQIDKEIEARKINKELKAPRIPDNLYTGFVEKTLGHLLRRLKNANVPQSTALQITQRFIKDYFYGYTIPENAAGIVKAKFDALSYDGINFEIQTPAPGVATTQGGVRGRYTVNEDTFANVSPETLNDLSAFTPDEVATILKNTVAKLQERCGQEQSIGSTLVACVKTENPEKTKTTYSIASVGDSHAILIRKNKKTGEVTCEVLNEAHDGYHQDEKDHIAKLEVEIDSDTKIKAEFIKSRLKVGVDGSAIGSSRSIGDCEYEKWGLRHHADTTHRIIEKNDDEDTCVILASDGLSEENGIPMSSTRFIESLTATIKAFEGGFEKLSEHLIQKAIENGSTDNITVTLGGALFDGHADKSNAKNGEVIDGSKVSRALKENFEVTLKEETTAALQKKIQEKHDALKEYFYFDWASELNRILYDSKLSDTEKLQKHDSAFVQQGTAAKLEMLRDLNAELEKDYLDFSQSLNQETILGKWKNKLQAPDFEYTDYCLRVLFKKEGGNHPDKDKSLAIQAVLFMLPIPADAHNLTPEELEKYYNVYEKCGGDFKKNRPACVEVLKKLEGLVGNDPQLRRTVIQHLLEIERKKNPGNTFLRNHDSIPSLTLDFISASLGDDYEFIDNLYREYVNPYIDLSISLDIAPEDASLLITVPTSQGEPSYEQHRAEVETFFSETTHPILSSKLLTMLIGFLATDSMTFKPEAAEHAMIILAKWLEKEREKIRSDDDHMNAKINLLNMPKSKKNLTANIQAQFVLHLWNSRENNLDLNASATKFREDNKAQLDKIIQVLIQYGEKRGDYLEENSPLNQLLLHDFTVTFKDNPDEFFISFLTHLQNAGVDKAKLYIMTRHFVEKNNLGIPVTQNYLYKILIEHEKESLLNQMLSQDFKVTFQKNPDQCFLEFLQHLKDAQADTNRAHKLIASFVKHKSPGISFSQDDVFRILIQQQKGSEDFLKKDSLLNVLLVKDLEQVFTQEKRKYYVEYKQRHPEKTDVQCKEVVDQRFGASFLTRKLNDDDHPRVVFKCLAPVLWSLKNAGIESDEAIAMVAQILANNGSKPVDFILTELYNIIDTTTGTRDAGIVQIATTKGGRLGRYATAQNEDTFTTGELDSRYSSLTLDQRANALYRSIETLHDICQDKHQASTALVCIVDGDSYSLANTGDSQAILVIRDKTTKKIIKCEPINELHDCENLTEVARIGENNFIKDELDGDDEAPLRLRKPNGKPGLNMTRAIGGTSHGNLLRHDPEIYDGSVDLGENEEACVILASDGLREADKYFVKKKGGFIEYLTEKLEHFDGPLTQASQHLTDEARKDGSTDNVTVVTIELKSNTLQSNTPKAPPTYAGIYDGAGGKKVSKAARDNTQGVLAKAVREELRQQQDIAKTLNLVRKRDIAFLEHVNGEIKEDYTNLVTSLALPPKEGNALHTRAEINTKLDEMCKAFIQRHNCHADSIIYNNKERMLEEGISDINFNITDETPPDIKHELLSIREQIKTAANLHMKIELSRDLSILTGNLNSHIPVESRLKDYRERFYERGINKKIEGYPTSTGLAIGKALLVAVFALTGVGAVAILIQRARTKKWMWELSAKQSVMRSTKILEEKAPSLVKGAPAA